MGGFSSRPGMQNCESRTSSGSPSARMERRPPSSRSRGWRARRRWWMSSCRAPRTSCSREPAAGRWFASRGRHHRQHLHRQRRLPKAHSVRARRTANAFSRQLCRLFLDAHPARSDAAARSAQLAVSQSIFLGEGQRVKAHDIVLVAICMLVGVSLVTIGALDFFAYSRMLEGTLDRQLRSLAIDIDKRATDEIAEGLHATGTPRSSRGADAARTRPEESRSQRGAARRRHAGHLPVLRFVLADR